MIFRFDDVCKNSDMELLTQLTDELHRQIGDIQVIWAISPIVSRSEKETQRVFPRHWNACSDIRQHYKLNDLQLPGIHPRASAASHGLVHIDHRLLSHGAQEMSIVLSCSLTGSRTFVPPFNKWNKDTETICRENSIRLIKFEDGWLSSEYNDFDPSHKLWYLHAREWTKESFSNWLISGM